jgi:hypothetical protein
MATTTNPTERIPAILTGHALKSLRDAGYDFPAAVAEVIDNSIEASANTVTVFLEHEEDRKGKTHVRRVAVADDGSGMGVGPDGEDVLQHYLQLGYSSRYMSETTIGKYGLGAKLAAFNFAERIDVWSCADADVGWRHVRFDLTEAFDMEREGKTVEISAPDDVPVPAELVELRSTGTGTLVVWSKVDRLEAGRVAADANQLRLDLEKELSRIFREFIHGGIVITVSAPNSSTRLLPHDPLFVMENTWADKVLAEEDKRKTGNDEDGKRSKKNSDAHFAAELIADEKIKIKGSVARLRVTLYPEAVTRKRGSGGDRLATTLRVPENQGAISFVRLEREINYTNVPRILPLGIQEGDRFIGIEVRFTPELDDFFGVRHVKRGVEPRDDLRDQIRKLLAKYIPEARERLQERWGKVAREEQEHTGEHAAITDAVKDANLTLPKGRVKQTETEEEHKQALEELAEDVGKETAEEKDEYVDRVQELPFVIESVSFPGQVFIDVQHFSNQVIIRLNTRHRFYRELWEPIREIAQQDPGTVSGEQAVRAARRTLEALSLLVVAYGKAESMDENPREKYMDLRNYWGQFLETLMGKVKDVI